MIRIVAEKYDGIAGPQGIANMIVTFYRCPKVWRYIVSKMLCNLHSENFM